jgi:hypothetical protein
VRAPHWDRLFCSSRGAGSHGRFAQANGTDKKRITKRQGGEGTTARIMKGDIL